MRIWLVCLVLLLPARPSLAESICERILRSASNSWEAVKATAKDIKEHPVARPYNEEVVPPKWFGVSPIQEPQGYLRKIFRSFPLIVFGPEAVRKYELSPFRSGYEYLTRRSFGWITEKILGQRMEPACIPRFLIAAVTSVCLISGALEGATEYAVWQATPHLETMMHSDVRYSDIKTPDQAFYRERQLNFYYRFMGLSGLDSPYFDSKHRFAFIYQDLANVFAQGIPPSVPGYLVPASSQGPLSVDQKLALVHLQDAMYIGFEMLAGMFEDGRSLDVVKEQANPIQKSFLENPFLAKLLEDRSSENLRKAQEYLFWQITFQKYDVIGIKKLKPIGDGKYSDTPMTIDDVVANEPQVRNNRLD